ncbi:hypothetical protein ACQPW1_22910 [Nocardia sp. CA-128927]|uniref:hypothetical protein n=1 Tax=Nocardia sp. CA-128927 TaxID=3239975 RepID=UPI003D98D3FD
MATSVNDFLIQIDPPIGQHSTDRYSGPQVVLVIGHTTARNSRAHPGTTVESFPGITPQDYAGSTYRCPMALVISPPSPTLALDRDGTLRPLEPPSPSSIPMIQRDDRPAHACRPTADLVPVWFHEPTDRFILAPYERSGYPIDVAIPAAVLAQLPHAPTNAVTVYSPMFQ